MAITITPHPRRIRVRFNGETVVDTTRALALKEGGYPPVLYLPRADADMSRFERTAHSTRCPYKGEASYYSLKVGDRTAANAVWTYETPKAEVAEIKERLAFYPDRVDAIEEVDA
jgi:uncharacterized protein (DUF427 family)